MTKGPRFQVKASGLTVTDNGDFFQLRNGANVRIIIHEIVVFQTSDINLAMNAIRIQRGVGGLAGTDLTEREWNVGLTAPSATAHSLPTTDVGTLDLDVHRGWNILQEFVWFPTPEWNGEMAASDHLGLSLLNNDALTIGCNVQWEEIPN